MSELSFYINGQLAPPPDNWGALEIELDFTNNSNDATIRATTLEWKGENAVTLNNWYNGGLSASYGIFEGIPFKITACDPAIVIFDGCIDMTSEETTFTCDIVKASIKETDRVYFISDTAAGFTFAYLTAQKGIPLNQNLCVQNAFDPTTFIPIQISDFVAVPYVISAAPDYFEVALMASSVLQLVGFVGSGAAGGTFGDMIQTIKTLTAQTVAAAAELASSLPGAVAVGVINTIWAAVQLAAYILYCIFMINMVVGLLIQIYNNLISSVKYKYGMYVRTLFEKACSYIGLNFQSSILTDTNSPYYNLVLIPKKQSYINNSFNDSDLATFLGFGVYQRKMYDDVSNVANGGLAFGYYEGTFQQLIMDIEQVFNAKTSIRPVNGNNTLFFERWDAWNTQSVFTMPPQSSEAPFSDPYGTNANELSANYELAWQLDSTDENTLDSYNGTTTQMQLLPNVIYNQNNVLLKGLNQITLPFSRAIRKDKLTTVENIFDAIYNIVTSPINFLLNLVGINSPFPSNPLGGRIGMMLLSTDFTGLPKLLIIDSSGKIDSNNSNASSHLGYTDAYRLMRDYHAVSWAVDNLPLLDFNQPPNYPTKSLPPVSYPNQYLTYKDKEIPLCCSDFQKLLNSNIINTVDGRLGRLDTLTWNPHQQTAKTDFRIKQVFTKNLSQTFSIDGTN